jgi:hypothetical protein
MVVLGAELELVGVSNPSKRSIEWNDKLITFVTILLLPESSGLLR